MCAEFRISIPTRVEKKHIHHHPGSPHNMHDPLSQLHNMRDPPSQLQNIHDFLSELHKEHDHSSLLKPPCLILRYTEAYTSYEQLVSTLTGGPFCHVSIGVYRGNDTPLVFYDAYTKQRFKPEQFLSATDAADETYPNFAIEITELEANRIEIFLERLVGIPYNDTDIPYILLGQNLITQWFRKDTNMRNASDIQKVFCSQVVILAIRICITNPDILNCINGLNSRLSSPNSLFKALKNVSRRVSGSSLLTDKLVIIGNPDDGVEYPEF